MEWWSELIVGFILHAWVGAGRTRLLDCMFGFVALPPGRVWLLLWLLPLTRAQSGTIAPRFLFQPATYSQR